MGGWKEGRRKEAVLVALPKNQGRTHEVEGLDDFLSRVQHDLDLPTRIGLVAEACYEMRTRDGRADGGNEEGGVSLTPVEC